MTGGQQRWNGQDYGHVEDLTRRRTKEEPPLCAQLLTSLRATVSQNATASYELSIVFRARLCPDRRQRWRGGWEFRAEPGDVRVTYVTFVG